MLQMPSPNMKLLTELEEVLSLLNKNDFETKSQAEPEESGSSPKTNWM